MTKQIEISTNHVLEIEELPDGSKKVKILQEIEEFDKLPETAEEDFVCRYHGENYIFQDNEWLQMSHYQPSLYEVYNGLKELEKRVEKLENKGE